MSLRTPHFLKRMSPKLLFTWRGSFCFSSSFLLTNICELHLKVVSQAKRMVKIVKTSSTASTWSSRRNLLLHSLVFSLSLLHRSDSTLNSTHSALKSHFFIVGHSLQVSFYLISNISSQICLQWQRGGCWLPKPLSHLP